MKRILQLILAILVLITPYAQGQIIFSEDFDGVGGPTAGGAGTYTFPAGWLLRNVDNRTPATNVAYVNEAWERREDFSFNVADSAAFSTSWYTPAGTANDWMWTPLIGPLPANCVLKWNAVTYDALYPDGYEVRIMTSPTTPTGGAGVIGNQITNSTVLFSTGAENTAWTARSVNLNAYAGQSVYIAFRNNSTDQFLLLIDDVVVEQVLNDEISLQSVQQYEYTFTPVSQVPAGGMALGGTVRNNGTNTASNVTITANVYDGANSLVYTATSSPTTIPPAGTATLTTAGFVPTVADDYNIQYIIDMAATDQIPANDTIYKTLSITNSVYARDNGAVVGALGIGAGNGGYLGQDFMIENTASVGSIQIYYTRGYTGERMGAVIWDMSGGVPNAIVAATDTFVYPDDSARLYTLTMHGGPVTLNPGRYAVTGLEFDSTVQIGLTLDIFTLGRTWVDWPTNSVVPWGNNEDYGASFERAYVIRPVICPTITPNLTTVNAICTSDGSATVAPTGGEAPYSYDWSTGGTNDSIVAAAGSFNVTITDNLGCEATASATIGTTTLAITSTTSTTQSICTAANGEVSVTPTNGTATYSYLWSNGSTLASVANLAAATYTVTVTDANGCSGTNTATVTVNTVALTSTTSSTDATCSAADGSASVTVTNGTAPYDYDWSNGATTAAVSNLPAGTYNVTLTDDNGCTGTNTATVGTNAVALTSTTSTTDATCSAADGSASVTVTNGTAPYDYDWSSGATTASVSNLTAGTYNVTLTDDNGCTGTNTATVGTNAVALTSTTSTTDATCSAADGSASVTVTNGTAPYDYDWSNGATTASVPNLTAGTYNVTLTDDNGCTGTNTATVGTNAVALTSTTSTTDATCSAADGSASVTVTNGTAPYDYDWSSGATTAAVSNLSAGTYNVTLTDDNGCTGTNTATVGTNSVALTSTTSTTDATCSAADGSASVTVTNGTAPYDYDWSNGATSASVPNLSSGTYDVTLTDNNGCTGTNTVSISSNVVVIASTSSSTDAVCTSSNGTATITVTNGTAPFDYDWSNSATTATISNLAAATYDVTITDDNGCTGTNSVTVTSSTITLSTTVNSTQATCAGSDGTASVTVTNGTSPYTYDWSNAETTSAISGLAAGTYDVTVADDNGCSRTATVDVTANQVALTLTTSSTATACTSSTGSATVDNVASGTAPYDYDWSNSATTASISALAAGSYQVTVTDDNGCSATADITVSTTAAPTASATVTGADCNGAATGGVDLTVSGGTSPISFDWNNAATTEDLTNVAAGAYTVTVTDDNGCSVTASATVTEPTSLTLTEVITNPTNGNNGSVNVTVSGGTPNYTFAWSDGGSGTNLAAGTYSVTVTDANGCTATESYTLISVGMSNIDQVNVFNLYPNPASSSVIVKVSLAQASELKLELVDMAGKVTMSKYTGNFKDNTFELNLTEYASGVYFIRLSGEHVNSIQRLIIER